MRYKLLLTGRNESAIDDFFRQMTDSFDIVTTSLRFADIMNHISFFRPDVFVYCLYNESRDDMTQIANLKFRLSHAGTPMVVFGLKEDCDEFEKIGAKAANLVLHRPLSVGVIQNKIIELVKDRRFMDAVEAKSEDGVSRDRLAGSAAPRAVSEPPAATTSSRKSEPKERKHILVVDDNAMMLKMIKEHLHGQYDVATAASGKVALKFLERKKTDLILLDYEMPDESGPVVLEKLRASEATRDIPVIFLTGVTETRKIKEALALKPQNYLLKPVDREKLMDTISKTIG